jgi:peptidoglycan hydrolase CwlO-like protein
MMSIETLQADLLTLKRQLEARLTAVEQAQNDNTQSLRFIVTTVAHMKSAQDDQGERLERLETSMTGIRADITKLSGKLDASTRDINAKIDALPRVIAEMIAKR